ncbi:hypothetical protein L3Q82_025300, partial [Scortum barcoo]
NTVTVMMPRLIVALMMAALSTEVYTTSSLKSTRYSEDQNPTVMIASVGQSIVMSCGTEQDITAASEKQWCRSDNADFCQPDTIMDAEKETKGDFKILESPSSFSLEKHQLTHSDTGFYRLTLIFQNETKRKKGRRKMAVQPSEWLRLHVVAQPQGQRLRESCFGLFTRRTPLSAVDIYASTYANSVARYYSHHRHQAPDKQADKQGGDKDSSSNSDDEHSNKWPTAQHQRHASQEEERTSKLVSLEEEVGRPPEADDECQASQKQDLQGRQSEKKQEDSALL